MNAAKLLFSSVALVVAGVVGYVSGERGLAAEFARSFSGSLSGEAIPEPRPATGQIIYYRHPDGTPDYAATPKNTSDGRPYVAVYESEDVSFKDEPLVEAEVSPGAGERKVLYYRNPMGLPDTSKVPKKDSMGMDYIPVYDDDDADGSVVKVSLGKLQRTGVKTALAERRAISRNIRVPGAVSFDERLMTVIAMRTDAFVEAVGDVTTGDRVHTGQALFRFYSKEIARAGAEYATELRSAENRNPDKGAALQLRNLGVAEETIREIAKERSVPTTLAYLSPNDGVILERNVTAGMMAEAGDVLFRIANTSSIWVIADVPEYDLPSIRRGAVARVTARSLPGKTFRGKVDVIHPELQARTRTTRVRIELDNTDGLLMANMYADVEIATGDPEPVTTVPSSAVIDTGDRRIVFVDLGEGRFEPRDVELGARGDDRVEIVRGLASGDRVVVAANFLLDAESNLNAALGALAAGEAQP